MLEKIGLEQPESTPVEMGAILPLLVATSVSESGSHNLNTRC